MDFNTHKKYAKLDDGMEDTKNMGVVVSDKQHEIPIQQKKEMDEADKLAKLITDTLLNKLALFLLYYYIEMKRLHQKLRTK